MCLCSALLGSVSTAAVAEGGCTLYADKRAGLTSKELSKEAAADSGEKTDGWMGGRKTEGCGERRRRRRRRRDKVMEW